MKQFFKKSLLSLLMLTLYSSSFANSFNPTPEIKTGIEELYKHLGNNMKYPKKASESGLQGNNIILFTVTDGKLQNLKIDTDLGFGCDVEALNNILSFSNFKSIKPGKYALKTTFKLDGSKKEIVNETVAIPDGYTALKMTIMGYSSTGGKTAQPTNEDKLNPIILKDNTTENEPIYILDGEIINSKDFKTINPNTINSVEVLKNPDSISKHIMRAKNGIVIISSKIKPNAKPLLVLDGKIFTGNLNTIPIDTIESVSVLKDAAATAIYGSRGANGVILITSKNTSKNKL